MKEVYIVSVARTPIGNLGGVLSTVPAIDLGKTAISAAVERAGIEAKEVGEVFMGCVLTANTGQAPAKQAALAAGIPNTVPCTTINKVCSSGMKAMMLGASAIMLGSQDVVVAGGMENMSMAPHYLPAGRTGLRYGNGQVVDAIVRDGLQDPYNGDMMGSCGEVCAEGKDINKEQQDAYAFASYERARAAYKNGWFDEEYKSASDWDFWLRCAFAGSEYKKLSEPLGLYYFNPEGMSTNPENKKWKRKEEFGIFKKYQKQYLEEQE